MSSRGDDGPLGLFDGIDPRLAVARADERMGAERPARAARTAPSGRGNGTGQQGGDAASARPGSRDRPLSISEVIRGVRRVLDRELGYDVWLTGESDSVSRHSSGHVYFALKDEHAQLQVVMWRSDAQKLRFRIESGQALRCRGRPTIYTRAGKFQFQITFAEPAGLGADALALEQRKRKLAAEGLFDPARKRPLPLLPRRIGVVTSKDGAAVRDIIRAVQRRFPVPILIADAAVQGDDAPVRIVAALAAIARTDVDVVIVGRGGGASSDLAAFNDERVVRAVAACPVPIISAVGHEIDTALTDLAADRRAATPTAAGELAVPVRADLVAALAKEERRLHREMARVIHDARQDIDHFIGVSCATVERLVGRRRQALTELAGRIEACHPRAQLAARRSRIEAAELRLHAAAERCVERARERVSGLEGRMHERVRRSLDQARYALGQRVAALGALSPLAVLERGYAIASGDAGALRDADRAAVGDRVNVRLARGSLDCVVERVHPSASADAASVGSGLSATPATDAAGAETEGSA